MAKNSQKHFVAAIVMGYKQADYIDLTSCNLNSQPDSNSLSDKVFCPGLPLSFTVLATNPNKMETESKLQSIKSTYKFRDVQTEQLFHYINLVDTNNIVVYGQRATCKTSIVRAIADNFELFHAWINVFHYLNTRNICESILKQVKDYVVNGPALDDTNSTVHDLDISCINSVVFIEKLEIILKCFAEKIEIISHNHAEVYKHKLVIVLDNVDTLIKDDNEEFLYLMNNIGQLTRNICPISVVYISTHSVEWLMRHSDFKSTSLEVVFVPYTNEELLQLFTSSALIDSEFSKDFYTNYVNIILKSLTPFTRNFVELKNICLTNFVHYIKPIKEEEMTTKETNRLYLRFHSKLQEIIENWSDHKIVRLKATIETSPSFSYLLVASYLASYNAVKNDKRHFVRNQGRFRERRKNSKKNVDLDSKPPKPFAFERLFAIYQALINLNETDRDSRKHLMVASLIFQEFNELIKQNLVFAIKSANTTSISSTSKYQLSDIVTTKHIDEVAFSIGLKLKTFIEN